MPTGEKMEGHERKLNSHRLTICLCKKDIIGILTKCILKFEGEFAKQYFMTRGSHCDVVITLQKVKYWYKNVYEIS